MERELKPIPIKSLVYPRKAISVKKIDVDNMKSLEGEDLSISNLAIRNEVIANSIRTIKAI